MLFSEALYSLATQAAQGKGGDNCDDGAGRKEMRRERERARLLERGGNIKQGG